MDDTLSAALIRILRPLVRLMIAKSIGFQVVSELLKAVFVEQVERHFQLERKRLTDSRISLLTGLQRRDVKRLRDASMPSMDATMGPVPRVLLLWSSAPEWQGADGKPLRLKRQGLDAPSFERLVADVSRDVHARSVLDALLADGMAALDRETDEIVLTASAYVPRDQEQKLDYLGLNLGDHASAAVCNVRSEDAPPFFERAAHFNRLSPASLAALDRLSRELQSDALKRIAETATVLQERDRDSAGAVGRFRCGAFVYFETGTEENDEQGGGEEK